MGRNMSEQRYQKYIIESISYKPFGNCQDKHGMLNSAVSKGVRKVDELSNMVERLSKIQITEKREEISFKLQ